MTAFGCFALTLFSVACALGLAVPIFVAKVGLGEALDAMDRALDEL